MPRKPIGDRPMTDAERQARRRAARTAGRPVGRPRRPADHRSRARRWHDTVAELLVLQAEYEAWLEALPDTLKDTATAEALRTISELDLSELQAIDPPRGFGATDCSHADHSRSTLTPRTQTSTQRGPFWTPIGGPVCAPVDNEPGRSKPGASIIMDPPHAIPRQGVIATVARRGVSVHHTRSQTGGVLDEELSTTIHRAQTAMRRGVVRVSGRIAVLLVGLLHRAFAHDPANYLFVASQTRPEITIIDSSTDELVGRITLPSVPGDMSALGRGRSLAIADRKASQVHFVDVLARRVEREMDVPLVPDVLRSDRTGTAIAAMDLSAGKVALGSIASGAFRILVDVSGATYIVFDTNGGLLVAHHAGATIVDAAERRVVAELPVDNAKGPVTDVAVDPGSEYAFLEQPQEGILSISDAHNARRVAVLHLPTPLGRTIPSEDSQFVLVPTGGNSIFVISTWTLNEKARAMIGVEADSVGLAFFQSVATIISQSKHEIILYDLWTNHLIGEIRLPSRPGLGTASSDGSKFYVALPDTGQVASINLASRQIDHLIDDVGVGVWTVVPAVGNGYCH